MMMWFIQDYYGTDYGKHGKIIDTSSYDANQVVPAFCARVGVEHRMDSDGFDQFKIDGQWRDAQWMMVDHKEETLAFLDRQLGLNKIG